MSKRDPVFQPGETFLGKYKTVRMIGRGGMGEVWLARDQYLSRDVALKVLPLSRVQDRFARDRIRREAAAGVQFGTHPNIVEVYDGGTTDEGVAYVVMKYLAGGKTLRDLVWATRGKGLPLANVASIGVGLARALRAMHESGSVHRDLKPENVMILDNGQVVLIDLGLARVRTEELQTTVPPKTPDGQDAVIGTAHYMSPEQFGGMRVSDRADVYALGCILHEALAGKHVFAVETNELPTLAVVTVQHALVQPALLRKLRIDVPPAFESLVARMLEKDPAARPSAGEVERECAAILRALVQGEDGEAATAATELSPAPRARAVSPGGTQRMPHAVGPRGTVRLDPAAEESRRRSLPDAPSPRAPAVLEDPISVPPPRPLRVGPSKGTVVVRGLLTGLAIAIVIGVATVAVMRSRAPAAAAPVASAPGASTSAAGGEPAPAPAGDSPTTTEPASAPPAGPATTTPVASASPPGSTATAAAATPIASSAPAAPRPPQPAARPQPTTPPPPPPPPSPTGARDPWTREF